MIEVEVRRSLHRIFGGIATLLLAGAAVAEIKPSAPGNFCIQGAGGTVSCASAPATTTTAGGVKWHPGHYLRPSEQIFASKDPQRFAVWDIVKKNPNLKGGLDTVPWGAIERERGVYDFSQIDKDIAYLKSAGKKLMLEPWWMNYWHSIPSNPGYNDWLPPYVIKSGCVEASQHGGYTVPLHRAECMDMLISMFVALGKKYDGNPDIEQIIVTEPSAPYPSYTGHEAEFEVQVRRLLAATAAAWPRTTVIFYGNWLRTPGSTLAFMANLKIGIGGPDIITASSKYGEDDGSRALRGLGGNFGSVDYRGKIAVSYSYEAAVDHGAPSLLLPYALDTLKATHLVWAVADWLDPKMNWSTGVLPVLNSANWRIGATACPSVYAGKCDTN